MLVVVDRDDDVTVKSLRNVAVHRHLTFDQLNTYDVLLADDVVFTKAAFDAFVAARSAEGAETVKLSQAATRPTPPRQAGQEAAKKARGQAKAVARLRRRGRRHEDPAVRPGSKAPLPAATRPRVTRSRATRLDEVPRPDSQWYDQTVAEVWFDSVESAEAAASPGR